MKKGFVAAIRVVGSNLENHGPWRSHLFRVGDLHLLAGFLCGLWDGTVLVTWWALRRWGLSAIGRHRRVQIGAVEGSGLQWAMTLVAMGKSSHRRAMGRQVHELEGHCTGSGKG